MRLLVDLQAMQNTSRDRGIGRYMRGLARGLLRNAGTYDVRFVLSDLFPDQIDEITTAFADLANPDQFHVFHGAGPTAALNDHNQWRSAASHKLYDKFIADLAPDVLLIGSLFEGGADNTVVSVGPEDRPYLVATILYDLIPLLNPDEHIGSAGARRWYFGKVDDARRADVLLGISASSCREALENIAGMEGKVFEVGAATDEEFASVDCAALRNSDATKTVLGYHGITRPYLMHTSALDPRKNFEGLIRAFSLLPMPLRRAHQLVLTCKLNPAGNARLLECIEKCGLDEDEVILTGYVPDDELRILYANSTLFVFPSFHEGFGLPVIEAMLCGAPAVGSCLSSVPEVIGMDEAQFDPYNIDQMVEVITRALDDEMFRGRLIEHAARHSRTFFWDAVAQRALAAIDAKLVARQASARSESQRMERVIEEVAQIGGWLGPSDADLMAIASALDRNELQSWEPYGSDSRTTDVPGIYMTPATGIAINQ